MLFDKKNYGFSLIETTSKEALLRSAMAVCGNDIKTASEICDYCMKMLPNMPEREPEAPTILNQLDGIDNWLSAWGEKHPNITNGISSMLMSALKNSKLGAFMQPAEAATEIVKPAPIQ